MKILETKRRLNGTSQTFECDLVHREKGALIIRYESKGQYARLASVSEGYYWEGRNYLIYKMFRDAELVGHRFDVCRDVTFGPDSVRWTDLLLDFFYTPSGELQVHDEDDVAEAAGAGLLTAADRDIIERTRALMVAQVARIIEEAAALRARAER